MVLSMLYNITVIYDVMVDLVAIENTWGCAIMHSSNTQVQWLQSDYTGWSKERNLLYNS